AARGRGPAAGGARGDVPPRPRNSARAGGRGCRGPRGREEIRHDRDGRSRPHAPRPPKTAGAIQGERTMRISEAFETDCRRVRAALRSGRAGEPEEVHLFRCEACRLEARIAAAWRALPHSRSIETNERVNEAFVRRVLDGIE